METLYLLGSMLYLLELYYNMWLPQLGGEKVLGIQLKEKLVDALFMAAKKEPQRTSRYPPQALYPVLISGLVMCMKDDVLRFPSLRCLSLYQIGMLAFSELRTCRPSQRLLEGIDILLTSLQVGLPPLPYLEEVYLRCIPCQHTVCRQKCFYGSSGHAESPCGGGPPNTRALSLYARPGDRGHLLCHCHLYDRGGGTAGVMGG